MRRILIIVSSSLVAATPVSAQQQGPEEPTIAEVEPSEARAGSMVEVRGSGWDPGSRVEIAHRRRPLGFATVAADGTWDADVRVPSVDPPTTIDLEVSGTSMTGEDTSFEVSLEVETGTPRGTWIVVGVVSLVVLLVLVLGWAMLVRQRRTTLAQRVAEGETPVRNPDPRKEPQHHDEGR